MPLAAPARDLSYAIERATLDNGLRVVILPDKSSPVVCVAVYYDVGMRSEPEGRTGFAHLFEHLMFQGSENVGKAEHFTHVQGAGGTLNGSTRVDYTNYFEVLPSSATELALFLESDRMRSLALTQENLDNQVAVVKNEILVNVQNQPYGGFPWLQLPPLLFDSFANAHDGYGSFVDLDSVTIKDAEDFFHRYYAPGNAVLTVCGDVDVQEVLGWVDQYFGPIPSRKTRKRPSFSEPPLTEARRGTVEDALAPVPAVALGWRVPDPQNLKKYLPYMVLAEVLTDGDASRLPARLLLQDRIALAISGYLGIFGELLDSRDPTMLQLVIHHSPAVDADTVVSVVDEEIARLVAEGLESAELDRTVNRMVANYLSQIDSPIYRAMHASVFEQQRGRAELLNELPGLLGAVTEEQVLSAAAALRTDNRAFLELRPTGASS